jgi:hypothetical protein
MAMVAAVKRWWLKLAVASWSSSFLMFLVGSKKYIKLKYIRTQERVLTHLNS